MFLSEIVKSFPSAESFDYVQNLNKSLIEKIDADNMYQLLCDYHTHLQFAINNAINAKQLNNFNATKKINKILILGIGGSAMGGELLRSYLKYTIDKDCPQIIICRGTEIPDHIIPEDTSDMFVFCCSYSGNTNETLQALEKINSLTNNIIACTSGGKLKQIALEKNYHLLEMPQGMMPRCAMFYAFFHLLYATMRLLNNPVLTENINKSIVKLTTSDFEKSLNYALLNNQNLTIILARLMQNKIPIIYSGAARLEAVNLRWRAQIQENANQICFGNYFPELNHNEINGWMFPDSLLDKFIFISMKDIDDSPELNDMINKSLALLRNCKMKVIEVLVDGDILLERLVRLICIADWTSFYLAIMNETDPTSIPIITQLKS